MIYRIRAFEEHEKRSGRRSSEPRSIRSRCASGSRLPGRQTSHPTRTCVVDRLLEPLDYLIVALEKAEGPRTAVRSATIPGKASMKSRT